MIYAIHKKAKNEAEWEVSTFVGDVLAQYGCNSLEEFNKHHQDRGVYSFHSFDNIEDAKFHLQMCGADHLIPELIIDP